VHWENPGRGKESGRSRNGTSQQGKMPWELDMLCEALLGQGEKCDVRGGWRGKKKIGRQMV